VLGDVVTGVVLAAVAIVLFVLGYVSGRWKAPIAVGAALVVALVASDLLYFGLGVNLAGYCGEPKCDPGPIPAIFALPVVPLAVIPGMAGVAARRQRQDESGPATQHPSSQGL
jgi:hypothetical protein